MSENHVSLDAPEAEVSIEIDPSLNRILDPDGALIRTVREEVSRSLAEILRTLGIPGAPTVRVSGIQENSRHTDEFMRMYVNGQRCRYPDELLQRVHSYVNEIPLDPETKPTFIMTWLNELSEGEPNADHLAHSRLVNFFSLVCSEIVKRQPSVLVGLVQVEAYAASLPDPSEEPPAWRGPWPPDPTWLLPILEEVLDLRISIADKQTVAEVLGLSRQRSREAVIEDLIGALHPDLVEIEVFTDYLRQLTTFDPENGASIFMFLRDDMFVELGLTYPPFRFVSNERLKPNSFAFKINHLTTLPWIGLQRDQSLVNLGQSGLESLGMQGITAGIPGARIEGMIIDSAHQSLAEAIGLTTWNQIQYFFLCFANILRENGPCFLHRRVVQQQLEQVSYLFPALVQTFQSKMSLEQTTRLLRALTSEGITIRDMRLILERILDHQYQASDTERYLILDDRLSISDYLQQGHTDDPVSFVRAGLKRQISNKYAQGTSTLVVYLVDPELENLFNGAATDVAPSEERQEVFITALANELSYLPPTAQVPSILTAISVRARFRDAIKHTFPRVGVLAYQELRPDLNVQPVARISLH